MSSSPSSPALLTLRSDDGATFSVEESAAAKFSVIKNMMDDGCAEGEIPVPNVSGKTLAAMMEWSKKHNAPAATAEELKAWDADFVDNMEDELLFDLLLAANFLGGAELLDLLATRVADMMKGKTPEEIRAMFGIENDFEPGEEEAIRKDNAWAFE